MFNIKKARTKQKAARYKSWGWHKSGVPMLQTLVSNSERMRQCRARQEDVRMASLTVEEHRQ